MTSGMISARKRRKKKVSSSSSNNRPRKRAAGTYSISIGPRKIIESTSKGETEMLLKKRRKRRKKIRLS